VDYPCAKFDNFDNFSFFVVLVLSCGQRESQTEADDRCTHATTIGVSNKGI